MDYYLSGQPQSHMLGGELSLTEMVDMDIKTDIENMFRCGGDFSLNFTELPALNLDEDSLGAPGDNNVWLTSSSDSHSLLGGDVNSSLSLDLNSGETRMVCPNSVMPVTLIQIPYEPPKELNESKAAGGNQFTKAINTTGFNNSVLRSSTWNSHLKEAEDKVKMDTKEKDVFDESEYLKDGISFNTELDIKQEYVTESDEEETFQEAYARAVAIKNNQATKGKVKIASTGVAHVTRTPHAVAPRTPVTNSTKRPVASVRNINSKKRLQEYNGCDSDLMACVYPKPAYSYSCLIAMALKNSPSGSLPVSEIYNFMCEHFPYFKTAPSGWKNSVRHNLSLNKCFEKIEKPAANGSQRKGCLWAMNPTKVGKMEEEVQKWSKKDKIAIKKSMVCPDTLDALEKGELSGTGHYPPNPGSIETIHSEMESEEETWDQTGPAQNEWSFKQESDDDEDDEDEEEDEEEDVGVRKSWQNGQSRTTSKSMVFAIPEELDDSDMSLSGFDLDVAESIYKDIDSPKRSLNLNLSPPSALQPLSGIGLSGGTSYTIKSHQAATSPKRPRSFEGSTISGNYVYKPIGSSSTVTCSRRKSPLRPTLITSFEADD